MERIVSIQQIAEIQTNIDYWTLQVPTYESNFSIIPRWRDNKDDPFICTAVFKKSYIENINKNGGQFSRCAENMLPAFFVYESDTLSIPEQLKICKKLTNDFAIKNWIFSQTYSGSKSIHTLVYIDPKYREDVAKDFRFYWRTVGERIFGDDVTSMLDTQCASIGRLSRNPNGTRIQNDGSRIKQKCIYFNPDFEKNTFNLSNIIDSHNKVLKRLEIQMQEESKKRMEMYANSTDDKLKLERIYNKGKCSDSFKLAYKVLIENSCPKGANYIAAASSLKGCGFSKTFIEELLTRASIAHPTNISKKSVANILRRLNV